MRKCIKKSLTDYGLELILIELDKHSTSDEVKIKMLNQSIQNSWPGVYPLPIQSHDKRNIIDFEKAKRGEVEKSRMNRYIEQNQALLDKLVAKTEGRA
jgi:hypothetical protein